MTVERVKVLVIGAGQGGVGISANLQKHGVPHLVVERARIAERWRAERWDSLVTNGPAWHDRFPPITYQGVDPDGFAGKDQVVAGFESYAKDLNLPIRCGVNVTELAPMEGGYRATTSDGVIEAEQVVVATGPFQRPIIPATVPDDAGLMQLHSSTYRNPDQLPAGAVLVVGAGSSGAQIADELNRAGRRVYLSVGAHDRPPRRYRGKDFVWWLDVLGKWDMKTPDPAVKHVTIAVSGAYGGRTMDFRRLGGEGVTLVGRVTGYAGGRLSLSDDLAHNLDRGDANYLSVLDEADAFAAANGLDLPPDPQARTTYPTPDCVTHPLSQIDLAGEGISTILWATGYGPDFGWITCDIFDEKGRPRHQDGVSIAKGLFFIGLPWLSHRGSAFIWGVWKDAERLAGVIAKG